MSPYKAVAIDDGRVGVIALDPRWQPVCHRVHGIPSRAPTGHGIVVVGTRSVASALSCAGGPALRKTGQSQGCNQRAFSTWFGRLSGRR